MNPQPLYPNPGPLQPPVPPRRKLTRASFKGIFSGPSGEPEPELHTVRNRRIMIVAIATVIAGGALWAYFSFATPFARARFNSNQYVGALVGQDVDYAAYLSSKTVDFSLIRAAAQEVKGEYKLVESNQKGDSYYFLYELTNTNNKTARTTVVKTNNGYRISSFIFSSKDMAVVPNTETKNIPGGIAAANSIEGGEAVGMEGMIGSAEGNGAIGSTGSSNSGGSNSGSSSGPASTGTKPAPGKTGSTGSTGSSGGSGSTGSTGSTPAAPVCLAQANYAAVFPDAESEDGTIWNGANPYNVQISFNVGGTDYVDSFEIGDLYAQWVAFYRAYPGKNYTIHVRGFTANAANNLGLASQRAEISRSALTRIGIPTNRIIVDGPARVNLDDNPDQDGYVTLYIIPGSGC